MGHGPEAGTLEYTERMSLLPFHPAVQRWFQTTLGTPTPAQTRGWQAIRSGKPTLIAAPTGSGKTLAAFLHAIDELVNEGIEAQRDARTLPDETRVLYLSPLKALSHDVEKNLQAPLDGIRAELEHLGEPVPEIRTAVRTGDTKASTRTQITKRPPHLLVTTPESFYILLTSEGGRRTLSTVRTVIVDEIHAVITDKRGAHLSLSLERLEALVPGPLLRIGLSATQKPIETVGQFLTGNRSHSPGACALIDTSYQRKFDLALELPRSPLEAVMANDVWEEIHERLVELSAEHRTVLIFVNTRRLAERLGRHLADRLGDELVATHHGSLSRQQRLTSEQRLKAGELKLLVATASLELGIDIGDVDLVCQIGSSRSLSTFLQRVGRSRHQVGGIPKGRLFPTTRDDLVECAALVDAVRRGELDELRVPTGPLDILAQQIVAACASESWQEEDLFALCRRAYPYRKLKRDTFDDVLTMLALGFATQRGRRGAYLHRDAVTGLVRGRKGARLTAITSGGAIPELADYQVVLEPEGTMVGTLNEDFAIESMAGDIFQLGNTSWRIVRVEPGKVRVVDAKGQPPSIPFWLGEAPGRSTELSLAVAELRGEVERLIQQNPDNLDEVRRKLTQHYALSPSAAEQVLDYLGASYNALGALPTQETLVIERFFDESGGMQLVLHAPFGSRLNRAWGLALRKCFCRTFNFELQAAANDDAIVLSLGPTHSFPVGDVFSFLNPKTAQHILTQALLDAPMFATRWRWNANRSLAVPRFRGGRKVAPQLQRLQADDLLTLVFPDQVACLENIQGARTIPDHPLVQQTLDDCLTEAMDVEAFLALVEAITTNKKKLVAKDVTEPSPLALEILNARPYAFLDNAPLEERRTQAVLARRWTDPATTSDLSDLDQAAIDRVREEAWPDLRDLEELHDALGMLGFLTLEEIHGLPNGAQVLEWLSSLEAAGRATKARLPQPLSHSMPPSPSHHWTTPERHTAWQALHTHAPEATPPSAVPSPLQPAPESSQWTEEGALQELLRSRLEVLGPCTAERLSREFSKDIMEVTGSLAGLEANGTLFRGQFTPRAKSYQTTAPNPIQEEWCDRGLLARIHRYTLNRLRKEIEPVSILIFQRFLFRWQGLDPRHKRSGPEALTPLLAQLEGFTAPARAWEHEIFASRLPEYQSPWLDAECLAGRLVWLRLHAKNSGQAKADSAEKRSSGLVKNAPIVLLPRSRVDAWLTPLEELPVLSSNAALLQQRLGERGALFYDELLQASKLLRSHLQLALGELVAQGLATADSYAGLRALMQPQKATHSARRRTPRLLRGIESSGRWALTRAIPSSPEQDAGEDASEPGGATEAQNIEHRARCLLSRYGVVFRKLLDRERHAPPWRELLRVYRRLEARGEIRGGRFVAGQSGEQYALPESIGLLREMRRTAPQEEWVVISAVDPTNLLRLTTPSARITQLTDNRILLEDGKPIAVRQSGTLRALIPLDAPTTRRAHAALLRIRDTSEDSTSTPLPDRALSRLL